MGLANNPSDPFTPAVEAMIAKAAQRFARQFRCSPDEQDDIVQEFRLTILQAAPSFDPKQSQWSTFAYQCIDYKYQVLMKHRLAACRDPYRVCSMWSTPEPDETENDSTEKHGGKVQTGSDSNNFDMCLDVASVVCRLPDLLQAICRRLPYMSVSEIARELKLSRRALNRATGEIRKRLKEGGLDEYL